MSKEEIIRNILTEWDNIDCGEPHCEPCRNRKVISIALRNAYKENDALKRTLDRIQNVIAVEYDRADCAACRNIREKLYDILDEDTK